MASAQQIINRALRLIGALASGETPSASESSDALEVLNSMLDAWRNESLMVYALREESLTITGAASYTIGPSGNLNTTRPVKIESAYQRIDNVDYPLRIADAKSWASLINKATTTADPCDWLYYQPAYPLGVLNFYPRPTTGAIRLVTWTPLMSFALSDSVALPPGYQEAITYQLAARLAIEWQKPLPPDVAAIGKAAKDDIKRVNFRMPIMQTGLTKGRRYNIEAGE